MPNLERIHAEKMLHANDEVEKYLREKVSKSIEAYLASGKQLDVPFVIGLCRSCTWNGVAIGSELVNGMISEFHHIPTKAQT